MTRQSKIRLAVVAFGGTVIALVIAVRIYLNTRRVVNVTDAQVRQMIENELPPGTTRSAVRHFLDSKGWDHSDLGPTTWAMIRDARHSFVVQTNIQIQFHFDSKEELVSYDLEDFLIGP